MHDPTMRTPSENVYPPPVGTSAGGWIEFLSRGLLVPSKDWVHKISQCEINLRDINGPDSLYKGKNIIKNITTRILRKFPEMPTEVVKIYARTRMFIRLRFMNGRMKAAEAQKRKSRQWHASSIVKPTH